MGGYIYPFICIYHKSKRFHLAITLAKIRQVKINAKFCLGALQISILLTIKTNAPVTQTGCIDTICWKRHFMTS